MLSSEAFSHAFLSHGQDRRYFPEAPCSYHMFRSHDHLLLQESLGKQGSGRGDWLNPVGRNRSVSTFAELRARVQNDKLNIS